VFGKHDLYYYDSAHVKANPMTFKQVLSHTRKIVFSCSHIPEEIQPQDY